MLFKSNDIAAFKQFINVSFTFELGNTFPGLKEAEEDYLVPIIGQELYDEFVAEVAATISEEHEAIINLCRKYVAPLSILLGLSNRHIKIGDTGLKKTISEKTDNLFKWEYLELKNELEEKAAKALNNLYKYLYANAAALDWEDPNSFKAIFKTADEFTESYPLYLPYAVFPMLKPIMKQIEKQFLHEFIGEEFLNELKEIEEPEGDDLKAINLLKDAIAHLTIYKATDILPVKITGNGLTVLFNRTVDQPFDGQMAAPDNTLSLLRNERLRDGNLFMAQLKKMLDTKASASVFTTYKTSSYYDDPTAAVVDRNEERKGVFGL
jgi:hypothetical protein